MSKRFTRLFSYKRIAALAVSITVWLVVLLLSQQSVAQPTLNVWSSNGPNSKVNKVVVDPINADIIYAAIESSGVFKSVNNGATWSASNVGLGYLGVHSLGIDSRNPNILYAGTVNGVFKTTNGAVTWSRTNSPILDIEALTVAPSDPRIIYAATAYSQYGWTPNMIATTDGGETWTTRPFPDPDMYANFLEVHPQNPNVIFTFMRNWDDITLLKTTDGGVSWTQFGYGNEIDWTSSMKIDSSNPNFIYAATYLGVYKSTDGGVSWTLRGYFSNADTLAVDPLNRGTLFMGAYNAGVGSAVYKSTDDGATWSLFNNGLPTNIEIRHLAIDRTGRYLYAATSTGVYSVRVREDAPAKAPFDFDGDNKTDISIFRPGTGEWWYLRSKDGGNRTFQFGSSTDKLVPGDYTGDGKTDIAFYRKSTTEWFVLRSEDFSFYSFPFGSAEDIPVPADYDGDGKTDAAVFRPSSNTWFIQNSNGTPTTITTFGVAGDRPVPADYDGDGKADIAIYRPGSGQWWLNRSRDGGIVYTFGTASDKCVPGDYTGDNKADVAFWRSTTGEWFVLRSEDSSYYSFPFGNSTDTPSPGDYDGDGKFDAAVFRSSVSTWFIQNSKGTPTTITPFGVPGDLSVPNAYVR